MSRGDYNTQFPGNDNEPQGPSGGFLLFLIVLIILGYLFILGPMGEPRMNWPW